MQKRIPKIGPIAWKKSVLMWLLVIVTCLLIALLVTLVTPQSSTVKNIDSFLSCKDAGGAILESYPEQCLLDGKTYVNDTQTGSDSDYVGLSVQAALDKAKAADVPARVVERDGESLAVTMDYVVGRHNFHVRNDAVYKVDVEGQE